MECPLYSCGLAVMNMSQAFCDHLLACLFLQGAVTYQLCNESLRWATVFREIERHRDELGVTDYSVSQTTLEQVSSGNTLHSK